ncbi:Type III restriction enzyme, res subunit [Musa troglodytarum]|uniref:Type III restriction enzyme, res subunit n=1 Tax=Musa troglodytarum TaxID=320322 RepID=A0A9E7I341_9LILI|nr:Type III restriction enzyme, res subunit [Musa troglodytarum]
MARVLCGCRALMAAAKAGAKVEAPAPKAAAKTKNFGILKPLPVSPAMEKFVGASEISRTGAIQKIREHIKLNQLQVLIPSCFELPKSRFFQDERDDTTRNNVAAAMAMTPQILLDVLRKGFLNLVMVHLMVIDECHHAYGNHPYNRLMKEFYHKSVLKPHIFGMTASPILRKVADRSEINMFVPSAKEVNRYYDAKLFIHEELKTKLRFLLDKLGKSSLDNYNDTDDIIKASQKDLSNYYDKICHCMEELGLVFAIEATIICIDAVSSSNSIDCRDFVMVIVAQCKSFLEEVLQKLAERLPEGIITQVHT